MLYLRRDKHKDMLRDPVLDVSDLVRAGQENSQVVCFQEPDERLGYGSLGVEKEENSDPKSTIMRKCKKRWQPAVIFGHILEDLRVVGEGEENLGEIKEMVMLVLPQ